MRNREKRREWKNLHLFPTIEPTFLYPIIKREDDVDTSFTCRNVVRNRQNPKNYETYKGGEYGNKAVDESLLLSIQSRSLPFSRWKMSLSEGN